MLIKLTKSFMRWCENDRHLITHFTTVADTLCEFTPNMLRELNAFGFNALQLKEIFGQVPRFSYRGYASFNRMRYIAWSWKNGDKILYPLNSENELYIGTDHQMWCSFWPFLKAYGSALYWCDLPDYTNEFQPESDHKSIWLGGQSHFGHFGVNFLTPLFNNTDAFMKLQSATRLYVPYGYTNLHCDLIRLLWNNPRLTFTQVGSKNGIFQLGCVSVPAFTDSTSLFKKIKGQLEIRRLNRPIKKGKYIFISRSSDGLSDRLFNPSSFVHSLVRCGFSIVDPVKLDIDQRLSLIGDAEFILTESGSCGINAFLFGNQKSVVRSFIPKSVLNSNIDTELNMLLPVLATLANGTYIPLETRKSSEVNNFYDKCIPPSIESVLASF